AVAWRGVVVYYGISLGLFIALLNMPGLATAPVWFGEDPPVVQDLVDLYNKGSLVTVMVQVKRAGSAGTLASVLPGVVRDYSIFHGGLFLAGTLLAVARVRRGGRAARGTPPPPARPPRAARAASWAGRR